MNPAKHAHEFTTATPPLASPELMPRPFAALWATFLAIALSLTSGCSMTLVPPDVASLKQPTQVHIVSHGVHSNLVLPRDEGNLGEYAFGEWEWFALGRDQWYRAFGALFIPSESALSRRVWTDSESLESAWSGPEPMITFQVEREKALNLSRELDAMMQASIDATTTASINADTADTADTTGSPAPGAIVTRGDTVYVRRDERYRLGNNCNHVLARWLEALDVRVIGNRTVANVHLREPATSAPPAP